MTPLAWLMFILSCLSLGIAFYIRFVDSSAEPVKLLLQMGVGMMCFGFFWLWMVIDGIPEKYPNPVFRILTSTFISASGGLHIATYVARRRDDARRER